MGKRKRVAEPGSQRPAKDKSKETARVPDSATAISVSTQSTSILIIVGSYDRVLHGISARILNAQEGQDEALEAVSFSDTFLFNAHSSAIRCLALSPPSTSEKASQEQKMILASGGTDERINLYQISASTPSVCVGKKLSLPLSNGTRVNENPENRELGSLLHHSSSINVLYFPTRSKLLSAAEDNTIAVSRTRDWTVLSTIKAPIPKAGGRPSGDTAPLGGTPAGINDFAVHPSMKLMISVGKGEKCMRLWNLVTGKKAGVLSFEREALQGIGEGKWASGEGRKVAWNAAGDEFAVAFEQGAVVFGMDSMPKCRILPSPATKLHQMRYISHITTENTKSNVLVMSTEDGRMLFYSTEALGAQRGGKQESKTFVPTCVPIAQLGGMTVGVTSRIKDFEILKVRGEVGLSTMILITGCSDGSTRLWRLLESELPDAIEHQNGATQTEGASEAKRFLNGQNGAVDSKNGSPIHRVGELLGTYETGHRITCLKAFVLQQPVSSGEVDGEGGSDEEFVGFAETDSNSDNSSKVSQSVC